MLWLDKFLFLTLANYTGDVLKHGLGFGKVLHWQLPDLNIFDTDPSLSFMYQITSYNTIKPV